MTRDALIAALMKVRADHNAKDGTPRNNGDAHEEADHLLLDYIDDPEVKRAYDDCYPFWYE